MTPEEMKQRTKTFALRILKIVDRLPRGVAGRTVAGQLARAGTGLAANYRSALKGRSKAEFIAKLGIAEEEADECQFWLDLALDAFPARELGSPESEVRSAFKEACELTAILAASRKSAQRNRDDHPNA